MKKQFVTPFVLLIGLMAGAQETKTTMQKAAEDICGCLSKVKYDSSKVQEYKDAAMNCFTTGAMEHIVQIAEERGLDVSDQSAMRDLGVEIGKELLKQKCASYFEFAKISAKEKNGEEDAVKEKVTSGKVLKVDKKDFVYITLKDASNREHNFIWLEYFDGSENFFGEKLNSLIGKEIAISWIEKEVYLPKANNYFKIKEISKIKSK
jgi:hypothetical protein